MFDQEDGNLEDGWVKRLNKVNKIYSFRIFLQYELILFKKFKSVLRKVFREIIVKYTSMNDFKLA